MSDLFEQQRKVVAVLQNRIVRTADANTNAGSVKDLALALGCAIDKLALLDPEKAELARRIHAASFAGQSTSTNQ